MTQLMKYLSHPLYYPNQVIFPRKSRISSLQHAKFWTQTTYLREFWVNWPEKTGRDFVLWKLMIKLMIKLMLSFMPYINYCLCVGGEMSNCGIPLNIPLGLMLAKRSAEKGLISARANLCQIWFSFSFFLCKRSN